MLREMDQEARNGSVNESGISLRGKFNIPSISYGGTRQ